MKKILNLLMFLMISSAIFSQTGVINNGARLIVANGAKLDINGTGSTGQYVHNENAQVELNGTISLEGNWENNSSSNTVFTVYGTNAQVILDGTDGQTIIGTTNFQEMTVEGNLNLTSDLVLPENLTINNGIVLLGNNNLVLGSNSEIVSSGTFSENNMIVTNGTGKLIKNISGNSTHFFPLGDINELPDFSPLELNISGTSFTNAQIVIGVIDQNHPNNTTTGNYIKRFWSVSGNGIENMNTEFTANYTIGDVFGNESYIISNVWNGTVWKIQNPVLNHTLSGSFLSNGDISGFGSSSSIANISTENEIKIFSNDNKIFISSNGLAENVHVSIYDLLGKTIYIQDINIENSTEINTDELKTGYYLVTLSGDKVRMTKKLFIH